MEEPPNVGKEYGSAAPPTLPSQDTASGPSPSTSPSDSSSVPSSQTSAFRPDEAFRLAVQRSLHEAYPEQLSEIRWFRTDWQRGGALTGYAQWRDTADDGSAGEPLPAVVKLPVPPQELAWLRRLQPAAADHSAEDAQGRIAPRLLASGEDLGSYDLAWVIMERLPHGPLHEPGWSGEAVDLTLEAAARFYAAASAHPVPSKLPPDPDWAAVAKHARDAIKRHNPPHAQRWTQALKKTNKKLKGWLKTWYDRPREGWCHGDLHLGNAMSRRPAPEGPAVLLDFALVRPGHWVEDAVYFEHLFWCCPDRLHGRKPCRQIAHARKELGLNGHEDWARLAEIRRSLLAIAAPTDPETLNNPPQMEASLAVLEQSVSGK